MYFHCGAEDHRKNECPKFSVNKRKELVKIQYEINAKKRGDKCHVHVGVVALILALGVEKLGNKCVSFK